MKSPLSSLFTIVLLSTLSYGACQVSTTPARKQKTVRFASYNVALYRDTLGQLAADMQSGEDPQIQKVAAVIQQVAPDVLALLEFDYDPSGQLLRDFQQQYLSKSQHGQASIEYPYQMQFPSNTGIPTPHDYNADGKITPPNDAFGYGKYPGQYAFALLSKFPIDSNSLRSYQHFLWQQMPEAKQPKNPDGSPYYTAAAWEQFRLSSKNHIAVPIKLPSGKTIHTVIAHPTPPVFDGPEDRNGQRNYDEIKLLKDIVEGADYLVDDQGKKGGLQASDAFVVMGDLNADPIDGDSAPGAIKQLLDSKRVLAATATGPLVPSSQGGKAHNKAKGDQGDPAFDTAFFGKRIDFVLPSKNLSALASGVFWPAAGEPLYEVVKDKGASDHLLVWVDLF